VENAGTNGSGTSWLHGPLELSRKSRYLGESNLAEPGTHRISNANSCPWICDGSIVKGSPVCLVRRAGAALRFLFAISGQWNRNGPKRCLPRSFFRATSGWAAPLPPFRRAVEILQFVTPAFKSCSRGSLEKAHHYTYTERVISLIRIASHLVCAE